MAERQTTAPPRKTPKRPTPLDDIPRVVEEASLDDHLEIMTRAIFQAGLSWAFIAARWPAFRAAFDQFSVPIVAAYGDADLDRLMATADLVHSEKKLAATIANARTLLEVQREYGTVASYASRFEAYADLYADAHERFAFVGDLSCYYWLFRTANPVPPFENWIARQKTDHPRMREMVELARATGTSRERAGFG